MVFIEKHIFVQVAFEQDSILTLVVLRTAIGKALDFRQIKSLN